MKTVICVTINRDHMYGCDTYFIGRSGENESTQFQINLEDCLCDSWVYIDFVKPDGTKYKTPRLEIVEGVVTYDIPNELLTNRGQLKAQIVLQNETGIVWKSTVKTYEVIQSIDATDAIPDRGDFITEAQKTLDDMEELKGEVEAGLTPTIGDNENWFVGGKDTGKPSRGPQGEDYIITNEDLQEVEEQVKTDIQPVLENIENISKQAEVIAKGKSQSVVKDTWAELEEWLKDSSNKGTHIIGDNLYIKAKYTDETETVIQPDYWIAEVLEEPNEKGYYYEISELGAEKPDLTEYAKTEQFVTLTQEDYDALETKSANTYYFIIEEE